MPFTITGRDVPLTTASTAAQSMPAEAGVAGPLADVPAFTVTITALALAALASASTSFTLGLFA